jgi:hypothetical protein
MSLFLACQNHSSGTNLRDSEVQAVPVFGFDRCMPKKFSRTQVEDHSAMALEPVYSAGNLSAPYPACVLYTQHYIIYRKMEATTENIPNLPSLIFTLHFTALLDEMVSIRRPVY